MPARMPIDTPSVLVPRALIARHATARAADGYTTS
jgi:hypothetical protein